MTLETRQTTQPITYSQAHALKHEAVWDKLGQYSVGHAIQDWLKSMSVLTEKNYLSGMNKLIELGLINPNQSLQGFSLVNQDVVIDRIKQISGWSESSRQARAACFISFTRYLSRRTDGVIKRAIPCREGTSKTFFKVREKVKTEAMNRSQWIAFLVALRKLNERDYLIAALALQGGKRINEVLSLTTSQIDFVNGEITFKQSKTKGYEKETIITYPENVLKELSGYLSGREGLVFITSTGNQVHQTQVNNTFEKAGMRAGIPFKITPHVLRASTVTYLKREGFADSEIMKVTGHASAEMVNAYDKSSRADNASKKVSLV